LSYSITKGDHGIVTLKYSGVVNYGERLKALEDICQRIERDGPLLLIVDFCEMQMNMTMEEQVIFGKYLANKSELSGSRIAMLNNNQINANSIVETYAYLGGYRAVSFDRQAEARLWLLGEIH